MALLRCSHRVFNGLTPELPLTTRLAVTTVLACLGDLPLL